MALPGLRKWHCQLQVEQAQQLRRWSAWCRTGPRLAASRQAAAQKQRDPMLHLVEGVRGSAQANLQSGAGFAQPLDVQTEVAVKPEQLLDLRYRGATQQGLHKAFMARHALAEVVAAPAGGGDSAAKTSW